MEPLVPREPLGYAAEGAGAVDLVLGDELVREPLEELVAQGWPDE